MLRVSDPAAQGFDLPPECVVLGPFRREKLVDRANYAAIERILISQYGPDAKVGLPPPEPGKPRWLGLDFSSPALVLHVRDLLAGLDDDQSTIDDAAFWEALDEAMEEAWASFDLPTRLFWLEQSGLAAEWPELVARPSLPNVPALAEAMESYVRETLG